MALTYHHFQVNFDHIKQKVVYSSITYREPSDPMAQWLQYLLL